MRNFHVAHTLPIMPTHPAAIFGIVDDSADSTMDISPSTIQLLAKHAEPSLQFIVDTWRENCIQHGISLATPLPPWLMVFGIVISHHGVTIVSHCPDSPNVEHFYKNPRFLSYVIDTIPFHAEVEWDPHDNQWSVDGNDTDWIFDRLKLMVALLSLVKHST